MKIYNSLSKNLEEFKSIDEKIVNIYVCGITPYDTTHLGHAFTYVSFDILIRYLKYKGFKVNYTQNVTDINDRDNDILKRAKEQNTTWQKLSQYWTNLFLKDMEFLNWIKPNNYLFASENLDCMIKIINDLLNNKVAYRINGSVYLDISKTKSFGNLSRLSESEMLKIAKDFDEDIDNSEKRHQLDITLWRESKNTDPKHIPAFDSPFGKGRPGWHLECSALGIGSLGKQIDIHGGGRDLIFPHHECEIAQSESATGIIPYANFWIHTGQISYDGEKMSKSLGNLVMVSKLSEKYSSNAIRYLLISHHYRQDWEFFEKDLIIANEKIDLISKAIEKNNEDNSDLYSDLEKYMDEDLNTPKLLECLENYATLIINENKGSSKNLANIMQVLGFSY